MVAVELDEVVRRRRVHFLQRGDVLVERLLVDLGLAAVDDLEGLAVVRCPWLGLQDPLTVEDFTAVRDDARVPACQCLCDDDDVAVDSPDPVNLLAGEHERHALGQPAREVVHV